MDCAGQDQLQLRSESFISWQVRDEGMKRKKLLLAGLTVHCIGLVCLKPLQY